MKKHTFLLLLGFMVSVPSFAADEQNDSQPMAKPEKSERGFVHRHEWFSRMKLNEQQREKMKEVIFKFKEEKITLVAKIKMARLNYEKLVLDPETDYKTAKAAAKDVADSISKLVNAKQALKAKIAFEILTPEQRKMKLFSKKHGCHDRHFRKGHDMSTNWG